MILRTFVKMEKDIVEDEEECVFTSDGISIPSKLYKSAKYRFY